MIPVEDFEALQKTVEQLATSSKRIEVAVCGDERFGIDGLIQINKKQDIRLTKMENWQSGTTIKVAGVIGAGSVIGFLCSKVWDWIVFHTPSIKS